jgi:hypothetical protein
VCPVDLHCCHSLHPTAPSCRTGECCMFRVGNPWRARLFHPAQANIASHVASCCKLHCRMRLPRQCCTACSPVWPCVPLVVPLMCNHIVLCFMVIGCGGCSWLSATVCDCVRLCYCVRLCAYCMAFVFGRVSVVHLGEWMFALSRRSCKRWRMRRST